MSRRRDGPNSGGARGSGRSARSILQAGLAVEVETRDPFVGALAGDAQLLGHVGHGATQDTDAMFELPTAVQVQPVVHEDLLVQ